MAVIVIGACFDFHAYNGVVFAYNEVYLGFAIAVVFWQAADILCGQKTVGRKVQLVYLTDGLCSCATFGDT